MSHFAILVIGPEVENQLAPYQENNMGDCPAEYLAFHDIEDESLSEYKTKTVEKVVMSDGRLLNTWDDEFRKPGEIGIGSHTHEVPEGLPTRDVPFTELYETFEEYMSEWCGHNARDSKTGRYGYWENPNKKWDWYSIGGRWSGFLKLKEGTEGRVGRPGVFGNKAEPGTCDSTIKANIDFDGMRDEAGEEAARMWEKAAQAKQNVGLSPDATWDSWVTVRDQSGMKVDEARIAYAAQPAVKAIRSAFSGHLFLDCDQFLADRETYINRARNRSTTLFGFVKDGKWFERGEMGWWGVSTNEVREDEWHKQFNLMLDELPDDTLITVVDCHI